ncbi:MAG: efflux transporter outer membrane subunit [Methyloceanibacter sp.]
MLGVASKSYAFLSRLKRWTRLIPGLCTVMLAPALSGCILGSEHPEIGIVVPKNYSEAPRAPEAAVPALDWWRGFHSKELTALIEEAQVSNLDIAVAIAQIIQADAQVGIAGSPLLPTIIGNGTAERIRQATFTTSSRTGSISGTSSGSGSGSARGSGSTSNSSGAPPFSLYNLNLTASYMVDFWGKNRATLYAAEESAAVSRYNEEVVALTTIVSVANAYFQVLAAQDQLRIAHHNLTDAERILAVVQHQFSGGTATQLEVSEQEALVWSQRALIPPLEVALRQNMNALAVLIGRPPENFGVRGGGMAQIKIPSATPGLPSEVLYQRPDVREAEAQLASSNFSVESARAAFFPQIPLTGETGVQSQDLAMLFLPNAWFYTLTAGLTQPIFEGFLLKNQLKQQRGLQLQSLETYRKAVLSAFSDVENALIALKKTSLQVHEQAQAVASNRRAFNVAEDQLHGGTINLTAVLLVEQNLFTAEATLTLDQLTQLQAAVSLFQALGGGWEQPEKAFTRSSIPAFVTKVF